LGVAKRALVREAMGAWSQVTCLRPRRTGVQASWSGAGGV